MASRWPTAISTEPRCTQLTPSSAERARRERRPPESVDTPKSLSPLDPLENDFSARDRQTVEMQGRLGPAKGKSFDGSNVLGPWIVTADEIGDPQTLKVEVRVNGEPRATGDTREMLFPFEEILAYASQDETIHAGEVFGSGTVGNCCGLEIGRFLESGDTVELSVDRIGVLKNQVLRQA